MSNVPELIVQRSDSPTPPPLQHSVSLQPPPLSRTISGYNIEDHLLKTKPGYKTVQLDVENIPRRPNVKQAVSFDTVALEFLRNKNDEHYDDEGYDFNHIHDYDDYDEYEADDDDYNDRARSPARSPIRSPSPRTRSFGGSSANISVDNLSSEPRFNKEGWRIDYPTVSCVNYDSLTTVYEHLQYKEFIKENGERNIILYITGRRHTWVSIDYFISKLLQDGDHLILITRIPECFRNEISILSNNNSETTSSLLDDYHTSSYKNRNKINPELFRNISNNIKKYLQCLISIKKNDIKFKITIDLTLGSSTVSILRNSLEIYSPHLIMTSTKPNFRFQRSHTWKTSRMTDRLVKNFPLPIIVVPSFTLNEFEVEFFNELNKNLQNHELIKTAQDVKELHDLDNKLSPLKRLNIEEVEQTKDHIEDTKEIKNVNENDSKIKEEDLSDESSIASDESSEPSSTSSSFKELTRTISSFHDAISKYVETIDNSKITKDSFLNKMNKISDLTYQVDLKFEENSTGGGEGAALMRSLTGLPMLEKRKSMLDVFDSENGSTMKMNNLKNQLSSKTISKSSNSNNDLLSPASRKIKFSKDSSEPNKLKTKFTNSSGSGGVLRKSKSHEVGSLDRPDLTTTISQPHLQNRQKEKPSDDNGKMKGFFSSLFKKKKK